MIFCNVNVSLIASKTSNPFNSCFILSTEAWWSRMLCTLPCQKHNKSWRKGHTLWEDQKNKGALTIYSVTCNSRIPSSIPPNYVPLWTSLSVAVQIKKLPRSLKFPFPVQFIFQYSDKIIFVIFFPCFLVCPPAREWKYARTVKCFNGLINKLNARV